MRLPFVHTFRDRHGKVRRYFRRPGFATATLPGMPGSPEFMEAYHAALAGLEVEKPPIGEARTVSGTISAAIVAYYRHNSFLHGLALTTQKSRRAILERFRAAHGHKRLHLLERRHLAAILGAMTPHAARNWLRALRGLMAFCLEAELIAADPTEGLKRAKAPRTEGFHAWTEAEIAQFEARWPIGTRERLAMALMLYTTLRRSDMVRLGPQHAQGSRLIIRKTARTTGRALQVALNPALADIIAASPSDHLTYLVTTHGAPFTANGFGNWFRERCDLAGLPHCSAHGLKKAGLRRVAEAAGTLYHLQAVSGNSSPNELQTYVRDADQARLAQQAVDLVAKAFPAKTGTRSGKPFD